MGKSALGEGTARREAEHIEGVRAVVGDWRRATRARSLLDLDDAWYGYGRGVVLHVTDDVRRAFTYESPEGVCAPGDPVLFKSASVRGDLLYGCTQTEVVVLSLPGFEVVAHLSLPFFNDVHHVLPIDDGTSVLVAVSGLELVVQVRLEDGAVLEAWHVLGGTPGKPSSPAIDFRMGYDLKPHRAHPNHLFLLGDEPFVTRFELRDAISLVDPRRRIDVGRERIHDGVVWGDRIYFTTVDGAVVEVDAASLVVVAEHELRAPDDGDTVLGWCRGLTFVDEESAWVGFSRIRPTRFRETVSWVRSGLARSLPTRIARYRTSDWTCVDQIDLEPTALNAVFTIAAADPAVVP